MVITPRRSCTTRCQSRPVYASPRFSGSGAWWETVIDRQIPFYLDIAIQRIRDFWVPTSVDQ
jgi:hypothetical protein